MNPHPNEATPSPQNRYNLLWLPMDDPSQHAHAGENEASQNHSTAAGLVYSPHSHYNPFQVAVEYELEAWARHAMANNGFGDISS